jgi:hypothetical protein
MTLIALLTGILTVYAPVYAEDDSADLAKKSQNPVSDLISVPFENNWNLNVGPRDKTQYVLNVKPVYPISLNEEWNLIARTIVPVISQPQMIPGGDRETGLGDIVFQGFLSPAKPGKLIWGVGPAISFPTATDDVLGTEKWSAGPAAVALTINGPWVCGGLAQNIWSFAGDDDRGHVSSMLIQPFINYNLPDGWYLSTAPNITANWAADDSDDRWTVPVGGGIGKIVKIGKLPVNLAFRTYYNVEKPDGAGNWQIQFQATLLFPR